MNLRMSDFKQDLLQRSAYATCLAGDCQVFDKLPNGIVTDSYIFIYQERKIYLN